MKSLCDMKAESPKPKTREEELQEYCENLEERIERLEELAKRFNKVNGLFLSEIDKLKPQEK